MHIIIPMSGIGNRFIQAGYKEPKPLIMIDGKTIIEHVCDLFPGENKITFICSNHHLNTTFMRAILEKIRPKANIIGIDPHKLGPVYAVSKIFDQIDDDEEVIVNYCDFSIYWDYADFLKHTRKRNADGAIPAYRHFHPHMLGSTNYAFMKCEQQWMQAIQEKKPFTDNRMNEFASNGTYYFKHGRYVKKYFQKLMDLKQALNNEYYVSMVYNLLHQDKLKISIYEVQHMLQWGTPEDVEEYMQWSNYFRQLVAKPKTKKAVMPDNHINLLPMAGRGQRFRDAGYDVPKPLISISGKPMVVQAIEVLPKSKQQTLVCLKEHLENYPIAETLKKTFPQVKIVALDSVTEGQAISCAAGLQQAHENDSLLIAACDNSMVFDQAAFKTLLADPKVDGIVFTFKNHVSVKRNPEMYGYVKTDANGWIDGVSVKVPLSPQPSQDHAIVGAFYFKTVALFNVGLAALKKKNHRINNEFYVDSLIGELVKLGYKLKPLLVDHYICWGTPNDLKTFEYWQSFFHKCSWHPYRLEQDPQMETAVIKQLDQAYRNFAQEYS